MEALLIKNAPQSFAMFLIAFNIPFRYSYGEFTIEDTHDEQKFISFALRNGVREDHLEEMDFSVITL